MTTHPRARRLPLLALALLAAAGLAGCDALQANPGSDFAVRPSLPGPLRASGRITVPFDFTVDGCAAFDAAMRGPDRSSHPVAVRARSGGGFTADLPTAWLRDDTMACADDDLQPRAGAVSLEITCRDAGRTVTLEVATSHATAARAVRLWRYFPMAVQFVFPGVDPVLPFVLAPSLNSRYAYFGAAVPTASGGSVVAAPISSFWGDAALSPQPRLALQGRSMFLLGTGEDFFPPCAPITVAPGLAAPCTSLLVGDPTVPDQGLHPYAEVPSQAFDAAFLPDGRLLVLSQLVDAWPHPTASVLSVVEGEPGGWRTTRVLAVHPGEWLRSGLVQEPGGGIAWLSLVVPDAPGPVRSVLHVTDGDLVADLQDPLAPLTLGERQDGGVWAEATWLSPDGSFVVVRGADDGLWLGPLDGPFTRLRADSLPGGLTGVGAAWPSGAVALWSGTTLDRGAALDWDYGQVQVFEAAPPHARRYNLFVGSLPGAHRPTQLVDATAVGDRLVLTTTSGVRILGPGGELIGGADPLPCGLSPTSLAARVGPSTVAVGAGQHVFTFDVAGH